MERLSPIVTTVMSLRPAFIKMKEAARTLEHIVRFSGNYNKTLALSEHTRQYREIVSIKLASILDDILCVSLPRVDDQVFEDVYKIWVGRAFYPQVEVNAEITDPTQAIRNCATTYAAFVAVVDACNLRVPQKYKKKFSNVIAKHATILAKLENDPVVLRRRQRV